MEKKQRTIKSIRRAIISAVIILILLILAGLIYTWYTGKNVESSSINIPVKKVDNYAEVKTVKPAENVPESVAVQSFTTPVLPGSNVSMVVRTKPDSTCKISVTYNKIPSDDSGLVDKISDEYGMVSWSWSVSDSTPIGVWPAKVSCYYGENGEQWAVVIGDLEVVSQID